MREKRETSPSTVSKDTKKTGLSKRRKSDLVSQIQNLQALLREKDEEISKLQAIINSTIQEKDEIIATLKDQLEAALNQKKVVEISNPVKQSPAESPHKKKYKLVPDQRLRKIPKSKTTIQKPAKSIVVQPRKSLRANLSTVGSLEYRASSALPQAVTVSNSNEKYISDSLVDLDAPELRGSYEIDRTEFDLHEDMDKMKDGIQKDLDKTKDNFQKDLDRMEDNLIKDLDKTKEDLQKNLDRTKDDLQMDLDKTEDDLQRDLDKTEDDLNEDPDYDVDVPDSLQQVSSDAENETEKGKVKSGKILKQNQCRIRRSKCPVCLAKFKTKALKNEHFKRTGHCFRFSCDQCGNSFKQKIELTRHIRQKHSSDLPFSCSRCDKKFKTAFSLARHEKNDLLHLKKPYLECEYCSKRYPSKRKALFARHLDIHLGKTSNPCEVCGKVFSTNEYLIVHSKVCSGQLEFQCTYCPRRFGYKATLVHHTRIHTQEKPYSCISCSSTFRSRPMLNKHWRKVHDVKEEPDIKDPDPILPDSKAEEEFKIEIIDMINVC